MPNLMLTRKEGESITVTTSQGDITISLVQIKNLNRVRIGIEAPRDVRILRTELLGEMDEASNT